MRIITVIFRNLDWEHGAMPFADSLAILMSDNEIPITADAIPERDITLEALATTQNWFETLDPAVRDGFDEGTLEFAICHIVAEDEVAVAPDLAGIFAAFDQVAGRTFSQLLFTTQQLALQAEF